MTRLPAFVRHDNIDADRIMLAAWFRVTGDQDISDVLARATLSPRWPEPAHQPRTDAETRCGCATCETARDIERDIVELAEVLADRDHCADEPEHFAWTSLGLARPPHGSTWDEYRVALCEEFDADASRLALRIVARTAPTPARLTARRLTVAAT